MKFNTASDIDAIGYDKILEIKEGNTTTTYLFRVDPSKYDPKSNAPALNQECWQIKRVKEVVNSNTTETIIEYPNGLDAYIYRASNYATYDYYLRRC